MKEKILLTTNKSIGNNVSKLYFFLILILLPLYMNKSFYVALINAKARCYWMIIAIVAVGIAIYYIQGFVSYEYTANFSLKRWNGLDWSVLVFAVIVLISCLLSSDIKSCFIGDKGFYVGTLMILSSVLFYFFASRNLISSQNLWEMVFVVSDIIFVWVFLNAISCDILNMHAQIIEEQYFSYFASLGQIDSVSAYLCLLLPVGIIFFINADKREDSIFYGVFCFLGFLAMFCIHTDGVYLGFVFCCIFLFLYVFQDKKKLSRFWLFGIIIGVDLTLLKLLFVLIPKRIFLGLGSVSNFLIVHYIGVVLIGLCTLLYFLLNKYYEKCTSAILKKIGIICSCVAGIILIGFAIHSALNFDAQWGNRRGGIWTASVSVFMDYSFIQKFFGIGTEMLVEKLSPVVNNILNWGLNTANCHNNILECLLSLGILGLIAYLFVWVMVIAPFFQKNRIHWSVERTAYFMALVAYFGQSVVGNPYSLTVPIVFLMLALYRNQEWREKYPATDVNN